MRTFILCLLAAVALGAADFAGQWAGTVEIPAGVFQVTLTLEQKGDAVTGSIAAGGDVYPVQNGKLSGNRLSFEVTADQVYVVACVQENGRLTGSVKPSGGGDGKLSVARPK
ncbi:MAG: hypothetical protein IT159_08205 [Bryobacterales bacterium]|nr:hypothetical protein [Bryobacterales bacterium]